MNYIKNPLTGNTMKSINTLFTGLFLSLVIGTPVLADDTEIYKGQDAAKGASNLVLVIDTSGSMGTRVSGDTRNRLQVVQQVVKDVIIANPENHDINVSVMRFNELGRDSAGNFANSGGRVISPLLNVGPGSPNSNKTTLNTAVDNLVASGATPLEEAYYESYLYMTGQRERFGESSVDEAFRPNQGTNHSNDFYQSPITHSCQKSSIILLTDGEPQLDEEASGFIRTLNGLRTSPAADRLADGVCTQRTEQFFVTGGFDDGNCMDELAEIMYENDAVIDDIGLTGPDNTTVTAANARNLQQNITTHTIGFATNATASAILDNTAAAGRGVTGVATDSASLGAIFTDALNQVIEEASNFTAPALTVNNYNRLTNKDDLYFSLFLPQPDAVWPGNIKKYKLRNGVIVDSATPPLPAIINTSGQFDENARSFWTQGTEPDGNSAELGGFASRLTTNRRIYSNLVSKNNTLLSLSGNRVNASNINRGDLGLTSDAAATEVIDWLNGLDAAGNPVLSIGDTLHTTPTVISYQNGLAEPVDSLFFGTNSGYLHSINVADNVSGNMENFAFFPQELLTRAPSLYQERDLTVGNAKLYGIDGPISSWIENDNGNGIVQLGSSEVAHLYATMRRGGDSIYAFNVTDVTKPILDWTRSPSDPGFEELGQTWSQVTPAKIPYGDTTKDVLIFGGGYDTNQDDKPDTNGNGRIDNGDVDVRRTDTKGRAIYIVDPDTGNLLWAATAKNSSNTGNTLPLDKMQYSIPSDISVLDVNGDGVTDRLYVGDMGGQLWRFDVAETTGSAKFNVTGGVIATLGVDGKEELNRRFYYPPNVARVSDDAFGSYLALAIGSGKRANPKGVYTNDKFYMIRDPYVFSPRRDASGDIDYNYTSSGNEILDGDVTDITNISNPTAEQIGQFGWSIDFLDSGEKVLAAAFTADNKIFFTTYLPDGNVAVDECDPAATLGSGRLYAVSLFNGRAIVKPNPSDSTDISDTITEDLENLTPQDRFADLVTPGIASTPQLFISDNSRDDNADADNDGIAYKLKMLMVMASLMP